MATDSWEETSFRRIECIAENPSDALVAVDERLRRMRRAGWLIPADAAVDLRPSGFGWAARLALPERDRVGDAWILRRRVRRYERRTVSSIEMLAPRAESAAEVAADDGLVREA